MKNSSNGLTSGPNGTDWTAGRSDKFPVKFATILRFVAVFASILLQVWLFAVSKIIPTKSGMKELLKSAVKIFNNLLSRCMRLLIASFTGTSRIFQTFRKEKLCIY